MTISQNERRPMPGLITSQYHQRTLAELAIRTESLRRALIAARRHIQVDRDSAAESVTDCEGRVDPEDQVILDDHDAILRQIDAALEPPHG